MNPIYDGSPVTHPVSSNQNIQIGSRNDRQEFAIYDTPDATISRSDEDFLNKNGSVGLDYEVPLKTKT